MIRFRFRGVLSGRAARAATPRPWHAYHTAAMEQASNPASGGRMEYRTKIALGCGGFLVLAAVAAVAGWWTMVRGYSLTSDAEEVRARSAAILPLEPAPPLQPFLARNMERGGGGDEAVIWAVDSRYQSLMLVLRTAPAEPESDEALIEALTVVHPGLAGFDPEPGAKRERIRVLGEERTAIVQTARTVDEARQTRTCVAFPHGGKWVLVMLQGDPVDAGVLALEKLLAPLAAGG